MQVTAFIRELGRGTLVGTGGIVLLCGFFSLFLAAPAQAAILPFITGFNGAVSGYNLAEKTGVLSFCWKSSCVVASFFGVAGLFALAFFAPQLITEEWREVLFFFAVFSLLAAFGGICLGRWIACKAQEHRR